MDWGLPICGSPTRHWDWQKEWDTTYEMKEVVLPCFRNSFVVHVLLGWPLLWSLSHPWSWGLSHSTLQLQSASWPRIAPSSGNLGDFSGCQDHLYFGVSIASPAARKFHLETSSFPSTHELCLFS